MAKDDWRIQEEEKQMRKEYDFSKGVRGKYIGLVNRTKKFYQMTEEERKGYARLALPFINSAILANAIVDIQTVEAQKILQNDGPSELIQRRSRLNNSGPMDLDTLTKEIEWWGASDDEYFAAQEKSEKKKKKSK